VVRDGEFREDLFYRLAVVPIHVPPLRERREDIPELIAHFLQQVAARLGKPPCTLAPSAAALLQEYDWPGNVREVENLTTRVSVLNTGTDVTADELRGWLMSVPAATAAPDEFDASGDGTPVDRSHLGTLPRPSRANGQRLGDRRPHADEQDAGLRLRTQDEEFCASRVIEAVTEVVMAQMKGTFSRHLLATKRINTFAPKGLNKSAQGNALGIRSPSQPSPERATQEVSRDGLCRPFRARMHVGSADPGRCPGLICAAPLGQSKSNNLQSTKSTKLI
jgi:transcriptional regulator with GAF, ATPase, and Fis domain